MGGKSGSTTIGYKYYFGIHMGISRGPVNELVQINVGDKAAWPSRLLEPDTTQENFNDRTRILAHRETATQFVEPIPIESAGPSYPPIPGEGLIRGLQIPSSWAPGDYVKLTDFKRISTRDAFDNPTAPTEIILDGVYQINFNGIERETDQGAYELRLAVSPDRYESWRRFGPAWNNSPTVDEFLLEKVADPEGTSLDPVVGPTIPNDSIKQSQYITINAPNLFGGEKAEGGIEGGLDVMMGEPSQLPPYGLELMHPGEVLSGYRRAFTCFYNGLIAAMNPYPKAWKFRVRRSTQGWDGSVFLPDIARIIMTRPLTEGETSASAEIHAMNPAHIIFECLTNREWGRGLPRSAINQDAFATAAGQLFSEGFGLCLRWTRSDEIETFVQSVLDHIGGTLYQDAETTLLTLKLIRGGYNPVTLPLFEPGAGLLAVTDAPVAAAGSYVNAVRVSYTDPISGEERMVQAQNLASIQASNGAFNQVTKNYPGIPTPDLAQRVAQRDLQSLGIELRKFTIQLDRRAYKIRPGDVIRIRDASRSIRETFLRITSYDDGNLQSGAIGLVGVQDIFDLPKFGFTGNQGGGWKPPTRTACIGRHKVFELPYIVYARYLSAADLSFIQDTTGRLGTVVEQGQSGNSNYKIARRLGPPTPDDQPTTTSQYCGYVPPVE